MHERRQFKTTSYDDISQLTVLNTINSLPNTLEDTCCVLTYLNLHNLVYKLVTIAKMVQQNKLAIKHVIFSVKQGKNSEWATLPAAGRYVTACDRLDSAVRLMRTYTRHRITGKTVDYSHFIFVLNVATSL